MALFTVTPDVLANVSFDVVDVFSTGKKLQKNQRSVAATRSFSNMYMLT